MDSKFSKLVTQFTDLESTYNNLKEPNETRLDFLFRLTATKDLAVDKVVDKFVILRSKIERLFSQCKNTPSENLQKVLAVVTCIEDIQLNHLGAKYTMDKTSMAMVNRNLDISVNKILSEIIESETTVRRVDYDSLKDFILDEVRLKSKQYQPYTALYATSLTDIAKFKKQIMSVNKRVSDSIRELNQSGKFKFPMTYVFAKKNRTRFAFDDKTVALANFDFQPLETDESFSFCETTKLLSNPYTKEEEHTFIVLV